MPDISDARTAWIQGRVLLGLGLDEEEFAHVLSTDATAARRTSGGKENVVAPSAADMLREFLGAKAGVGSSLFFHAEIESVEESEEYTEEYQETEIVRSQQLPGEGTSTPEVDGDIHTPPKDGKPDNSAKASSDLGDIPTEHPKTPDAPTEELLQGAADEPIQPIETEMRLITKMRKAVRKIITTKKRCRVTHGNLPDSSERVVYFVKILGGEVASPASSSDHENMVTAMEYGCLAGDCLTNLSAVIKEVFAPLLDQQLRLGATATSAAGADKVSPEAVPVPQDAVKVGDNLRNEFRANLHKFESQVTHATQQVKGDVHLSVPSINIDDPDIGNDFEAVSLLEAAMEEWSRLIAAVVEAENLKRVKGKGPMAEIEFWRRRNASLSALYEQINMPKVLVRHSVQYDMIFMMLACYSLVFARKKCRNFHMNHVFLPPSATAVYTTNNEKWTTTLFRHGSVGSL